MARSSALARPVSEADAVVVPLLAFLPESLLRATVRSFVPAEVAGAVLCP
ncbi:MAG: hypothetical protein AB8G96_06595 [Phycisphaerales bacterium]